MDSTPCRAPRSAPCPRRRRAARFAPSATKRSCSAASSRKRNRAERLAFLEGESLLRGRGRRLVQVAEVDPPSREVVGRHLEGDPVAGDDADVVPAYLAPGIGKNLHTVGQLHPELRVGEHLLYRAL